MNVFSDCSETKINYEEFLKVAEKPEVTDVNSFLAQLPAKSMSLVGLAHTSLSLQKEGINPEFPGVIRGTADGKIIFRYVCNPDSELKSNIEIMRFDETSQEFKFSSIHFNKEKKEIIENPQECLTCHQVNNGVAITRPVWSSYPLWPGMYGSVDDDLTPNIFRRRYAHENFPSLIQPNQEKEYFDKFIKNHKANPCYNLSLPENYNDLFKLARRSQRRNSSNGRTNQKFSESMSMLYAQSLANRVTKIPQFNEQVPAMTKAIFGCGDKKNTDPDYEFDPSGNLVAPRTGQNGLFINSLKSLGLKDEDFTIAFHSNENDDYIPGVLGGDAFNGRDLTFISLLRTQLANKISIRSPELKKYYTVSRAIQEGYYKNSNACLDDLGGRLLLSKTQRNDVCKLLHEKYPNGQAVNEPTNTNPNQLVHLKANPGFIKLVESCARCHAKGGETLTPQFMLDQNKFLEKLQSHDGFAERMTERMASEKTPMPPRGNLSVDDQRIINEFLAIFKK